MKYILEVQVRLHEENQFPGLQVQETVQVEAIDFLECAQILGKFHELAQVLKSKKEAKK
jgi:hypothetical protein